MVSLIWSLVAASSRLTVRWLPSRSSWVTAGGFGSCEPTAGRTCETPSPDVAADPLEGGVQRRAALLDGLALIGGDWCEEVLSGGGDPLRAAALLMPSSIVVVLAECGRLRRL